MWEEGSSEDGPSLLPSSMGVGAHSSPARQPSLPLDPEATWPGTGRVSSDSQLSLPSGADGRVVSHHRGKEMPRPLVVAGTWRGLSGAIPSEPNTQRVGAAEALCSLAERRRP